MGRTLGWVMPAVTIVAAVALAAGAYVGADYAWDQIVDYESPFLDEGLPPASAGPVLGSRVVLVIVDGMTDEASREMSSLEGLRAYGGDFVLLTDEPSLSYPTWTTILSGAPPQVSGVTTNWFEGPVRVETLLDTVLRARQDLVVVGPTSFEELYDARRAGATHLVDRQEDRYMSEELVDAAVRLADEREAEFVLLHLPDLDEAGHHYGAASEEYAAMVERVDGDLSRLVGELEGDGRTTFVVVADHGHVATGGHGGWEDEVRRTPAVFAGAGVALAEGEGLQRDLAPTVATLAGVPSPRHAFGSALESVIATSAEVSFEPVRLQRATFVASYLEAISGDAPSVVRLAEMESGKLAETIETARDERLSADRSRRLPVAAVAVLVALAVFALVGVISWRALASALAGVAAYYVVYGGLFFVVHGHRWSLSAFDSEDLLQAFFYARMAEALLAGLVAAAVAGFVYVSLRSEPRGPHGRYLPGWLTLGAVTVLLVQLTLLIQEAWFFWRWGVETTWLIPDLRTGFKFDLDLVQTTALGVAAVLGVLVTWLVGRYHPRTASETPTAEEE